MSLKSQWRRTATRSRCEPGHRSPIVVLRVGGTTSAAEDVDRSRRLVSLSATRCSSSDRYAGAVPCRQPKTSTESLNSIRSDTRSQWRSYKQNQCKKNNLLFIACNKILYAIDIGCCCYCSLSVINISILKLKQEVLKWRKRLSIYHNSTSFQHTLCIVHFAKYAENWFNYGKVSLFRHLSASCLSFNIKIICK